MIQTRLEEWINSISHYLGAILALIGSGVLGVHAFKTDNIGYFIGTIVFSISMVFLYSMSGTYHILYVGKLKKLFKILDHSAIYVLIAGSYTPYLLGVFEGQTKWILFSIQWGITVLGIVFKLFFVGKLNFLSTLLYLVMGWMIVFVFKDLKANVTGTSLNFLIASGVTYSIGAIFYLLKNVRFSHNIWHFFVLTGSILNYFSVYTII